MPLRGAPRWILALILALSHPHAGHASQRKSSAGLRVRARTALQHHIVPAGLRWRTRDNGLAARILSFARGRLGTQVGDGQCYDLADAALHEAGAKSAPAYGDITAHADYVWGRPIDLRDARPGDIVQFHGFRISTAMTTTVRSPDGGVYTTQSWQTSARDHHTAIVEQNSGGMLSLLEQNAPPLGPRVQRNTIPVESMAMEGAPRDSPNTWTTSQISVEGTVRAYRPQPDGLE